MPLEDEARELVGPAGCRRVVGSASGIATTQVPPDRVSTCPYL